MAAEALESRLRQHGKASIHEGLVVRLQYILAVLESSFYAVGSFSKRPVFAKRLERLPNKEVAHGSIEEREH